MVVVRRGARARYISNSEPNTESDMASQPESICERPGNLARETALKKMSDRRDCGKLTSGDYVVKPGPEA